MKTRNVLLGLMVIILIFFSAGNSKSSDDQNETKTPFLILDNLPEFRISKGEVLYSRYCLFCHGESGLGDGLNAFNIPDKPADFSNQELMNRKSDDELEKVILLGGTSFGLSKYMPAFGNTLSVLQVKHLVDFIRKQLTVNNSSE